MIPLPPSGGRVGERVVKRIFLSAAERRTNLVDHSISVSKHVEIPNPKDSVTAHFQVCGSFGVVHFRLIGAVPASVQLDKQVFRSAGEVRYVLADWVLPPELVPLQPVGTQTRPQAPLGVGCVCSELPGSLGGNRVAPQPHASEDVSRPHVWQRSLHTRVMWLAPSPQPSRRTGSGDLVNAPLPYPPPARGGRGHPLNAPFRGLAQQLSQYLAR